MAHPSHYGIEKNSGLHLALRLNGGSGRYSHFPLRTAMRTSPIPGVRDYVSTIKPQTHVKCKFPVQLSVQLPTEKSITSNSPDCLHGFVIQFKRGILKALPQERAPEGCYFKKHYSSMDPTRIYTVESLFYLQKIEEQVWTRLRTGHLKCVLALFVRSISKFNGAGIKDRRAERKVYRADIADEAIEWDGVWKTAHGVF